MAELRFPGFLTLLFLLSAAAPAQETVNPIPREYRGITLGMESDEVKSLLTDDAWFDYRGDASLSLLKRPRASLIEVGGSLFILRGLFQFEEGQLSAIILELNPETIDWFTVYTTLEERYGRPADIDPEKVWWEDASTRLALERPLTVKYLDLQIFETALNEEENRKSWRETLRGEFLDEF